MAREASDVETTVPAPTHKFSNSFEANSIQDNDSLVFKVNSINLRPPERHALNKPKIELILAPRIIPRVEACLNRLRLKVA